MTFPRENNKGAVVVMALFYGIFLVAILFHVVSVGGAALEQEVMQNAADATTFSAATTNARGMNLIAFVNMFMAFALAFLVGIKVLEVVLVIVVAIATVLCAIPWTTGAGCTVLAAAEPAYAEVKTIAKQVEKIVMNVLKGLTKANNAFKEITPFLAEAEAIYISVEGTYKPAQFGFVWPLLDGLPVKEGEFGDLCHKAGENVSDVIFFFAPDGIQDTLGDALGGLVETFSGYFCGDDSSGGPPRVERTEEVGYPSHLDTDERNKNCPAGRCSHLDVGECNSKQNWPNHNTGECHSQGCKRCAKRGCDKCFGYLNDKDYVSGNWHVLRRTFIKGYDPDLEREVTIPETTEAFVLEERTGNPCDFAQSQRKNCGSYLGDWESVSPICSIEMSRYPTFYTGLQNATKVIVDDYQALLSCAVEKDMVLEANGEPLGKNEETKKIYPQVVDEERYPEDAKMKGVVVGGSHGDKRLKMTGFATDDDSSITLNGRLSFASAFYYSREEDVSDALWTMKWTTRLIRFRLKDDEAGGDGSSGGGASDFGECGADFAGACQNVTGGMGGLMGSARESLDLILH